MNGPEVNPSESGTLLAGRRTSSAAWLAVALLCLPVLLGSRTDGGEPSPAYGMQGYSSILREVFGPMDWLQLNAPGQGGNERPVSLSPEAESFPEVVEFAVRSPLQRDLAASDLALWDIRGAHVAGLVSTARLAPPPFRSGAWTGDIAYSRPIRLAQLAGEEGDSIDLVPLATGAGVGALNELSIAADPGRRSFPQALRFTDSTGNGLADIRLVGDAIILFPMAGRSADVLLNGRRVKSPGRPQGGPGRPMLLSEGDLLAFSRNGTPIGRSYRLLPPVGALSRYRPFAPRLRDETLGSLGSAMEAGLIAARLPDHATIPLALDPNLHRSMQADLEELMHAHPELSATVPVRAAALAMDTTTGEVLSLASYPEERAAKDPARLSNQNFVALPIGSAAKPIISAAILSQYPDLDRLVITTSPVFSQVLGIDLEDEHGDHAGNSAVDFTQFLKLSSNKYAVALMLLALARDPFAMGRCPSEPYSFTGRPPGIRRYAPEFTILRQPPPCGSSFGPFNGRLSSILERSSSSPHWLGVLQDAYDIPGVEEDPADRVEVKPWRAGSMGAMRPDALRMIAPERESFRLGSVRRLYNDYLNLILGGVHSRWTTFKVAEAYSRLVMGRRISASLVHQEMPSRPQLLTGLRPRARASVLAGMEEVVRQPNGTAYAALGSGIAGLERAGRRGERIRIFAKTGTPTLQQSVRVPARVALDNLASQGLLSLDARGMLSIARKAKGETDVEALSRLEPLRREAVRERVSPRDITVEFFNLRRELAASPRNLRGADGRLRLPTTRAITSRRGGDPIDGGVFAMVIGRYCAAETRPDYPIAALTLVVNVQARGAVNPALLLTAQWLKPGSDLLLRLYEKRASCRSGGAV